MRAGQLRHRVTVQRYTVTRNSYGEEVQTWAALFTAWMGVTMVAAAERFAPASQTEIATVTHRVRMRYRSDYTVTVRDRLLYNGKVLEVESAVDPDGRRREIVMLCRNR